MQFKRSTAADEKAVKRDENDVTKQDSEAEISIKELNNVIKRFKLDIDAGLSHSRTNTTRSNKIPPIKRWPKIDNEIKSFPYSYQVSHNPTKRYGVYTPLPNSKQTNKHTTIQPNPPTTDQSKSNKIWIKNVANSPIQRILEERLSDPDVHRFPLSGSLPLKITLQVSILNILSIAKKTKELEMTVSFTIQWRDQALSWDPKNYSGIKRFGMSTSVAWTPDIVPLGLTRPLERLSPPTMSVSFEGVVTWRPVFRLTLQCDVKKRKLCTLRVSSWIYDTSLISLSNPSSGVDMTNYFHGSKYRVSSASSKSTNVKRGNLEFSQINASFSFRRQT